MARKVEIIPATAEHAAQIAANVRDADRAELAACGKTPEQVMLFGLSLSGEVWTGLVDDEPVCMFGVAPTSIMTAEIGRPWLVGSRKLDDVAVIFLRRCRPQLRQMFSRYRILSNYVAADNVRAIDWLAWLGFDVHEAIIEVGAGHVPFRYFEQRRAA